MSARDLRIHIAWFDTGMPKGPALGTPETLAWPDFLSVVVDNRRVGTKDGTNFIPSRFMLEPDGRQVRRLGRNAVARTAIALDCETSKDTGEVPPAPAEVVRRLQREGWAGIVYTSHSHTRSNIRFRVVLPLSGEIAAELPAPEIIADNLGLEGVLDRSKLAPASLFYLPSCADEDLLDGHEAYAVDGSAVAADWVTACAQRLLEGRQAEADRVAAEAHAEAAKRRATRLAAGFDQDESLIERIRAHLDLDSILRAHGYDVIGSGKTARYRHPNSSSGGYGANIEVFGGVQRLYSHNGTDPLHPHNLPEWCTVSAIDAFDATAILDYDGDRTRALRELGERLSITKTHEKRQLAALIFRLIRQQAAQEVIEAAAAAEGERLGLSRTEVRHVSAWANDAVLERAA